MVAYLLGGLLNEPGALDERLLGQNGSCLQRCNGRRLFREGIQ